VSTFITVEQAQATLKELIGKLIPGEEIIITDNERPVARLVAVPETSREPRQPGTLRGTVLYMAPDFDAPLDDFKEYME
jgi:antitoxin (DNA-binding transcriptional repressor) of toxin-antitoxin stability system